MPFIVSVKTCLFEKLCLHSLNKTLRKTIPTLSCYSSAHYIDAVGSSTHFVGFKNKTRYKLIPYPPALSLLYFYILNPYIVWLKKNLK